MSLKDKTAKNEYQRQWYADNKLKHLAWAKRSKERAKRMYEARLAFLKARPCIDCNQVFHSCAMDFDHVRGVKRFGISTAKSNTYSWGRILVEIAKCELVCANCHRIRTYNRARLNREDSRIATPMCKS